MNKSVIRDFQFYTLHRSEILQLTMNISYCIMIKDILLWDCMKMTNRTHISCCASQLLLLASCIYPFCTPASRLYLGNYTKAQLITCHIKMNDSTSWDFIDILNVRALVE